MSNKIQTSAVFSIDSGGLREWLIEQLTPHFPTEHMFSIIPHKPHDPEGESCFFANIDLDHTSIIDMECFLNLEEKEYRRAKYHHWYAQDVCNLAYSLGALKESHYHLYYRW